MLVLVAFDASLLEFDEPVGGQEVSAKDGLLDIGHLEIPGEPTSLELQRHHPRTVAANSSPASPNQVVLGN